MADSIEDPFAVKTQLLGLMLLPGQEANLRAAYAVLRDAIALVGADYPFEAEPAHVFAPARGDICDQTFADLVVRKGETALAIDTNEPAAADSRQIGLDRVDWHGGDGRDHLRLEAASDQRGWNRAWFTP